MQTYNNKPLKGWVVQKKQILFFLGNALTFRNIVHKEKRLKTLNILITSQLYMINKFVALSLVGILGLFSLFSCTDKPDDVKDFRKDGSIEMTLSTDTVLVNSMVIMRIEYKVWKNNQLVHLRTITDTLPPLNAKVQELEDNDGNTQSKVIPTKYDFFVTVK